VAPNPSSKAVGKRLFIPHRLRQLFSSLTTYYQRADTSPSHRIGSYLHRVGNYISPSEARLTSASQVPLSSTTVPQAEYDFTTACEAWAHSHDLDIFNDLLQPFQTQPLIPAQQGELQQPVQQATIQQPVQQAAIQQPVHQAAIQQPVHQAAIQQPVHQAAIQQPVHQAAIQQPVHQAQQPVHQALLPDLPALEGPQQSLRIEPPVTIDSDLVLRDPTPAEQAARIALPPSPPSVELALHDCPVEPVSQEIVIPDAVPATTTPPPIPFSEEITLNDAPPQADRQPSYEPSDIEHNHWAESHVHIPSLARQFEGLLVGNTPPNQWNTEHSQHNPYPSSTSSRASYPSGFTDIDAAMPAENQPQQDPPLAEAGPSNYGRSQGRAPRNQYWAQAEESNPSQFFRPATHFNTRDGTQYPYTPYAPHQARPTPTQTLQAENEQLRKAIEAERQMRRDAEARLHQRARATPAQAQHQETRLEGLQQPQYEPAQLQGDNPAPEQPMAQQLLCAHRHEPHKGWG
jgi:hypothetical protein